MTLRNIEIDTISVSDINPALILGSITMIIFSQRNYLIFFLAIEILLLAPILQLCTLSQELETYTLITFILLLFTIAAIEMAIGLSGTINLYKVNTTINLDNMHQFFEMK
jgi:NADH:ubiquinone oxidoreductase subunit K